MCEAEIFAVTDQAQNIAGEAVTRDNYNLGNYRGGYPDLGGVIAKICQFYRHIWDVSRQFPENLG